jgi:hypothetical protein
MMSRAAGLALRMAGVGLVLVGLIGTAILLYPLPANIDCVQAQSSEPLPASLRQALRYSLSEDGSDSAVRYEAAKILLRGMPGYGRNLGPWPLLISTRLLFFSDVTQSERLVMQSYQARCWNADIATITEAEALYLAARTKSPGIDDPAFIKNGMARIGQRMVAAGVMSAPVLEEILESPLPMCK